MNPPRRILLIRPSALGDVCRTVPLLASMKRHWPDAEIDWLVQRGFEDAVAAHPDLSRVLTFDRRALSLKHLFQGSWWSGMEELASRLRAPEYDLVIDAQGLFRSAFFARLTGAPLRAGYAQTREFGGVFLNRRIRVDPRAHTVDRMLALIEGLDIRPVADMRLHTSERDRAALHPELINAKYAVVAPTSRWPGKRWPADRFAEAVRRLLGADVVEKVAIVGARSERDHCTPVLQLAQGHAAVIDLVGHTTVGTLMATIERSAIVLANDSAALHMGVGFNRPLVALYGPTDTALVGPYQRHADVIQHAPPGTRLDHKDAAHGAELMNAIQIEEVVDALLAKLGPNSAPNTGLTASEGFAHHP